MFEIYQITNLNNGKIYIGQTCKSWSRRWAYHKWEASHGSNRYLAKAIRKHGPESFEIKVIGKTDNKEWADILEKSFIKIKRSFVPEVGYNSTLGGDGMFLDSARKEQISAEMRERWRKNPYMKPALGHRHTEEYKKKMVLISSGSNNPAYRHDVKTEEILALRAQGLMWIEISKKLGIHRDTIRYRLKHGVQ